MELTAVRAIWSGVTIGGLVLTFVGAGLGLLGYVQTGKVDRRLAAVAPYDHVITRAAATVSVIVESEEQVNLVTPTSGGSLAIGTPPTSLLTASDTSCRIRQLGNGRVEYSGSFLVSPDDACMGRPVRDLATASVGNVRFAPMGAEHVMGGSVTLLVNGDIRFDVPIPEQTTDNGVVVIQSISEILSSQIPTP